MYMIKELRLVSQALSMSLFNISSTYVAISSIFHILLIGLVRALFFRSPSLIGLVTAAYKHNFINNVKV
jgi:uncharacterized membrane protein